MSSEISLEAKQGIVAMLRELADEAERKAAVASGHHAQSPRTALYAERDRLRRWAREVQNIDEIGTAAELARDAPAGERKIIEEYAADLVEPGGVLLTAAEAAALGRVVAIAEAAKEADRAEREASLTMDPLERARQSVVAYGRRIVVGEACDEVTSIDMDSLRAAVARAGEG